ncbi:LytR/AlgR family response regulator transcription factor [Parapedobacter indicus]|uniref:Two component transcriptional regulator, LytTR family n=1 Tax=Parapedobacter indicus TaxID=1477437 RepID=A0A1I3H6X8_9SPHI|nr:response regulator transcription factor [Parapedobacter indicus]PPL02916.1 DNA-binding LytR/AlgR family response regulator [Parapedobacter indicus]SFI31352.1 two component transcriptional regulator, LytTR family [Parapedobacter indicus]
MPSIRCILVDDELPALQYLQMLCSQLSEVEVVKSFNNPAKFLNELDRLDFDACVLDIRMPGGNGLQLAQRLKDKAVIFSTAYKEYASEAFDLDAVDYLRKPYQLDRLEKAFAKARDWLAVRRSTAHAFELNTSKGKVRVKSDEIAFIEVAANDRRDKEIAYRDGSWLLAKNITFDQLLLLLPKNRFCRINRKTIIAVDAITSYTQQWVSCSFSGSGMPLRFPLSAQYRADLKNRMSG